MVKIRIHGRGGQGGATMAGFLAEILYLSGDKKINVQSSPSFGPERRGSPVKASIRFGEEQYFERGEIADPDVVVVLDETLKGYTAGLKNGGTIVINSGKRPEEIMTDAGKDCMVACVNASAIAIMLGLGDKRRPFVNTAMIGAFIKASGLATEEALSAVFERKFGEKAELNKQAARQAADSLLIERRAGNSGGTTKK